MRKVQQLRQACLISRATVLQRMPRVLSAHGRGVLACSAGSVSNNVLGSCQHAGLQYRNGIATELSAQG